jgi:hypothetical protein
MEMLIVASSVRENYSKFRLRRFENGVAVVLECIQTELTGMVDQFGQDTLPVLLGLQRCAATFLR